MIRFYVYGHENIRAEHKTTLEFTKDQDVTEKGNCIIGVKADFEPKEIKAFSDSIHKNRIRIIIKCNNLKEEVTADINTLFSHNKEIVVRKSNYICTRTFAINADKAAADLSREFVKALQNPNTKIEVVVEECKKNS